MKILIVEDEKDLVKEMDIFLKKEGFVCEHAFTGGEASEKIFTGSYDFILLDLGLPDYNGLDLLKEIKSNTAQEAAVIILSARGSVSDRISGLDLGADDYLPKPFSLLELLSRIQSISRRKHGIRTNVMNVHGYELDITNRTLSFRSDRIGLTKKEFDVLVYLVLHKNRVLTRFQITEHIWGDIPEDVDSNYIDVHIKNIRKKLSVHGTADWLETVRGIGYKLIL